MRKKGYLLEEYLEEECGIWSITKGLAYMKINHKRKSYSSSTKVSVEQLKSQLFCKVKQVCLPVNLTRRAGLGS